MRRRKRFKIVLINVVYRYLHLKNTASFFEGLPCLWQWLLSLHLFLFVLGLRSFTSRCSGVTSFQQLGLRKMLYPTVTILYFYWYDIDHFVYEIVRSFQESSFWRDTDAPTNKVVQVLLKQSRSLSIHYAGPKAFAMSAQWSTVENVG